MVRQPRLRLKPHVGQRVAVRGRFVRFLSDVFEGTRGDPVMLLEDFSVANIDEQFGHCHIRKVAALDLRQHEEVKFTAVVERYICQGNPDYTFDGSTVQDLMVLRDGRWVVPAEVVWSKGCATLKAPADAVDVLVAPPAQPEPAVYVELSLPPAPPAATPPVPQPQPLTAAEKVKLVKAARDAVGGWEQLDAAIIAVTDLLAKLSAEEACDLIDVLK
jgi:hypothetical protein